MKKFYVSITTSILQVRILLSIYLFSHLILLKFLLILGSFRGIRTLQMLLKLEFNYDVSQRRLMEIMRRDPIYLMHQRKYRKIQRRNYVTHNYGELTQVL